jgi:hypothetical protein
MTSSTLISQLSQMRSHYRALANNPAAYQTLRSIALIPTQKTPVQEPDQAILDILDFAAEASLAGQNIARTYPQIWRALQNSVKVRELFFTVVESLLVLNSTDLSAAATQSLPRRLLESVHTDKPQPFRLTQHLSAAQLQPYHPSNRAGAWRSSGVLTDANAPQTLWEAEIPELDAQIGLTVGNMATQNWHLTLIWHCETPQVDWEVHAQVQWGNYQAICQLSESDYYELPSIAAAVCYDPVTTTFQPITIDLVYTPSH